MLEPQDQKTEPESSGSSRLCVYSECGSPLKSSSRKDKRFCSDRCRAKFHNERKKAFVKDKEQRIHDLEAKVAELELARIAEKP